MTSAVPLAISSCLLGEAVRYDGKHKRDGGILADLGPYVRWLPFCPEVMAGLGVPRPPIERDGARVVEVESRRDVTASLAEAAAAIVAGLRAEGVRGYVAKARSPSCDPAAGFVLEAVRAAFADLPVASEEELATSDARAAFLRRVR